ncbi:hypothetical protein [Bordetella genomosp. 9]|nr:hypothetical protein [Bordetella genomosp. 9]
MGAAVVPWSMVKAKTSSLRFHKIELSPAPTAQIVVASVPRRAGVTAQAFVADFLSRRSDRA